MSSHIIPHEEKNINLPIFDEKYDILLKVFVKRFSKLRCEIFVTQDNTDCIDLCKQITGLLDMIMNTIIEKPIDNEYIYFPKNEYRLNELVKKYNKEEQVIIKDTIVRKISLIVWTKWYIELYNISNNSHHLPGKIHTYTQSKSHNHKSNSQIVLKSEEIIVTMNGINIGKLVLEAENFIKCILHLMKSDRIPEIDNFISVTISDEQLTLLKRDKKLQLLNTDIQGIPSYRK